MKLSFFNVRTKLLHIFYETVVENAICFAAICWGSSIRASDPEKVDTHIKKSETVLETGLEPVIDYAKKNVAKAAQYYELPTLYTR